MFNSVFLDVAIGMIFIFLLYSILATAILEIIASIFKLRARYLFKALFQMLKDRNFGDQLAEDFQKHPLIKKITFTGKEIVPSYVSQDTFLRVFKDLLPDFHLGKGKTLTVAEKIELLPEGQLKKTLITYLKNETRAIDDILKDWFDVTMERLTGSYKRMTQYTLFIIGMIIAIAFNVDSFAVFDRLSTDKKAREMILRQAQTFVEVNKSYDSVANRFRNILLTDTSEEGRKRLDSLDRELLSDTTVMASLDSQRRAIKNFIDTDIKNANNALGIGWDALEGENLKAKLSSIPLTGIIQMILGWLITAIAITVGAPFWFDLLQKLVRIRGSGVKHDTQKR